MGSDLTARVASRSPARARPGRDRLCYDLASNNVQGKSNSIEDLGRESREVNLPFHSGGELLRSAQLENKHSKILLGVHCSRSSMKQIDGII
jgi:hypothetical protein